MNWASIVKDGTAESAAKRNAARVARLAAEQKKQFCSHVYSKKEMIVGTIKCRFGTKIKDITAVYALYKGMFHIITHTENSEQGWGYPSSEVFECYMEPVKMRTFSGEDVSVDSFCNEKLMSLKHDVVYGFQNYLMGNYMNGLKVEDTTPDNWESLDSFKINGDYYFEWSRVSDKKTITSIFRGLESFGVDEKGEQLKHLAKLMSACI